MNTQERLLKHFWPKVDTSGECWLWIGSRGRHGYGLFHNGTKLVVAHRFLYEAVTGEPIHTGLVLCHRCDNPPCVRFEHLFLGSHADNMTDRNDKGRQASGERHVSRTHPEVLMRGDAHYARREPERLARGEAHGRTTLTEAQVRDIRARFTGRNGSALAREYGVDKGTVSNIIRRRTWAHLD